MRLGTALTLIPFTLVVALALGLGIAGRLSTHDSVQGRASTPAPTEAAATSPTATAVAPPPSSSATASASAAPSASANDPSAMLQVHNDLRAAIGAPAVRGD